MIQLQMMNREVTAITFGNAIFAGSIFALTDCLALSGTGHLAIISALFDFQLQQYHLLLKAMIELAIVLAVCFAFRKDVTAMIRDTVGLTGYGKKAGKKNARFPEARTLFMLSVATVPLLFMLPFRSSFFSLWNNSVFVGLSFLLNGCILLVCEKMLPGKKGQGSMLISDALIVGVCQCVALIPGISRLAVCMTACVAEGFNRQFSVRFSMLMAIPAFFGSFVLSLADAAISGIDSSLLSVYFLGMAAAFIVSYLTVYAFRRLIIRRGLGPLSYYCFVIGLLTFILTMIF